MALLTLVAAPWAYAVTGAPPTMLDAAFYTFGVTGTLFYALIICTVGPPRYLSFAVFAMLMLLLWSTLDGTLTYLVNGGQTFADSAPLVAAGVMAGYGYAQAALNIEADHRLAVCRPWFFALGACCLVIPLGLPFFSYFTLYLPMNALVLAMLVAQILPPLTWHHLSPLQRRWGFVTPVAMAGVTLGIYGAHFAFADFTRPELDVINRGLFLSYLTFSLAMAAVNVLAMARDKERAEKASLLADKREAEAKLALAGAEQRYADARRAASEKARQLASASHDLKQPISALRMALEQVQEPRPPGSRVERMLEAVGYLEQLAGAYAAESSLEAAYGEADGADADRTEDSEMVPLDVVMRTLERMFAREAAARAVALRLVPSTLQVDAVPLAVMRMLSNLVSNAIKHGRPGRVVVGVRRRGALAVVQVVDDGAGMSAEELARYLQPRHRSPRSDGEGLGLAIVQDLASSLGYLFEIRSEPGRGTRAEVALHRRPEGTGSEDR